MLIVRGFTISPASQRNILMVYFYHLE